DRFPPAIRNRRILCASPLRGVLFHHETRHRVHAAIKVKESPQSQAPQLVLKERRLGQPATYYL
ncbi:MAG TPA: hypothetical protein VN801_06635, partial [Candidatus Udaeobacter sp.]|nr:hypothetical protein [Candidatus Udaeobacter sp.]